MHVSGRAVLHTVPLNLGDIPQAQLDIAVKTRSNPLPWRGQFSPQFVQVLLDAYTSKGAVAYDPFAGSGTVLFEAGRRGLAAIGVEINPAACILARTYEFVNYDHQTRLGLLEEVGRLLEDGIPRRMPLLDHSDDSAAGYDLVKALCSLHSAVSNDTCRSVIEALMVKLDIYRSPISEYRIFKEWQALRAMITALPASDQVVRVLNCDAREVPLSSGIIDLVITSPPYINVHNYHQQYRGTVEALGWKLLKVAQSEMGANRKHRGNRFLTVIQYCLDMAQALSETGRLCKAGARIIVVIGRESTVRGIPFDNGEIVARLGTDSVGLPLVTRQERVFTNRFGERIFEDILHFRANTSSRPDYLGHARSVACHFLGIAYSQADDATRRAIDAAVQAAADMQPSPIFDESASCSQVRHRQEAAR